MSYCLVEKSVEEWCGKGFSFLELHKFENVFEYFDKVK